MPGEHLANPIGLDRPQPGDSSDLLRHTVVLDDFPMNIVQLGHWPPAQLKPFLPKLAVFLGVALLARPPVPAFKVAQLRLLL
jgi:hypothetical protein